jgi:hypothetical protein
VARQKNADFADGGESWTDAQLVRADGLDAVEAQRVLLGSAIATGAAGVATFVLSWVEPPAGGFAAAPTVVPTEGGVAVGFAGRF